MRHLHCCQAISCFDVHLGECLIRYKMQRMPWVCCTCWAMRRSSSIMASWKMPARGALDSARAMSCLASSNSTTFSLDTVTATAVRLDLGDGVLLVAAAQAPAATDSLSECWEMPRNAGLLDLTKNHELFCAALNPDHLQSGHSNS